MIIKNEPNPMYFVVLKRLIKSGMSNKEARRRVKQDKEYQDYLVSPVYYEWLEERYPLWREQNKWVAPSSDRRKKNLLVMTGNSSIKVEIPIFSQEVVRRTYKGELWTGRGKSGINKEIKNVRWQGLLSSYSKYEDNKNIFKNFGLSPAVIYKGKKYNFTVKEILENGVILKLYPPEKSKISRREKAFNMHYKAALREYLKEYDEEKAEKMATEEAIFLSAYPELDNPCHWKKLRYSRRKR